MNNQKIVIAGGSGFIGQALISWFAGANHITVLTRGIKGSKTNAWGINAIDKAKYPNLTYVTWLKPGDDSWQHELEAADILINMAGTTVNCRYTAENKKEILESRVQTTRLLGDAIRNCTLAPKLWINASSATIYPNAKSKPFDETTTEFANDFSVQVCKNWEKTFFDIRTPFTRKIALRMAITLGAGGVMTPYFNLLKWGLGGRQGNGKQMYSWVHVDDTCRMIEFLFDHPDLEGVYNCVSPGAVTNREFMRLLRKSSGTRFGLPAPSWLLKLGAPLAGTETELVLKSRWVLPNRILNSGFQFKFPELGSAFNEIIRQTPRKNYRLF